MWVILTHLDKKVQGAYGKFLTGETLKFFSFNEAKKSCNTGIEREFCGILEDVRCEKVRQLIKSTGLFK